MGKSARNDGKQKYDSGNKKYEEQGFAGF
ncbi:uncharacterized protein G2W53_040947 [Senna tora]|uniref:Uncharacterized protein n=1 Tax=Senna tora TaxID=362788 RepID=A0A834SEY2_9FABA|nr:uncharacterized protein G2W53_040947 [Senna tora]